MKRTKIYVETLGCPKNLVRTQDFYRQLDYSNYEVVYSPEEADVIVVNTCGFIADAVEESLTVALQLKEEYPDRVLVFAGCVPLRFGTELVQSELPEFDYVVPGFNMPSAFSEYQGPLQTSVLTYPYAYVSIAEGCNGRCSYCTIPKFWGSLKSRPAAEIVDEINELYEIGIREVILVSQDTGAWGTDLYGRPSLELLLRALRDTQIPWIRLMYVNPTFITEKLLLAWKDTGRVLPYFDIPVQSGSDKVLRQMRRGYDRNQILQALKLIDGVFAENTKRTSIMVGFPGETEDDVQATLDLLIQGEFHHVGVFGYCDEEEADSHKLVPKVDPEIINTRKTAVEAVALELHRLWEEKCVGKTYQCLVEASSGSEFIGRIWGQAPEIDGMFLGKGEVEPGEMVEIVVEKTKPGQLIGRKKVQKATSNT